MSAEASNLKAFAKQLTALQRPLYLYIVTLVHRHADAEDILQETNRVMWEKMDEFTPETNFPAWAYRIAFNEVRTYRKRKSREAARMSDALVEQLAVHAETALARADEKRQALHRCLERLPEKDREIVTRRYFHEASVPEVAKHIGRSSKAIYHALSRIRSRLLGCMKRSLAVEGTA